MLRDKRADGLVVNKWGTLALILRVCNSLSRFVASLLL